MFAVIPQYKSDMYLQPMNMGTSKYVVISGAAIVIEAVNRLRLRIIKLTNGLTFYVVATATCPS